MKMGALIWEATKKYWKEFWKYRFSRPWYENIFLIPVFLVVVVVIIMIIQSLIPPQLL